MIFIILLLALVLGESLSEPWISQIRDKAWLQKHQQLVNMTKEYGKHIEIVFLGDSITYMWGTTESNGLYVWDKYYKPRHAYNYGIGGDGCEHVMYRVVNKEFDGLKPKVVVLMIGTNNLKHNTVEDIAHGVREIVSQLFVKMPTTKVLLLGILPRPTPYGEKAKEVNALIKKLGNEKTVLYLDMWSAFEAPDGHQKSELFIHDKVHLNESGYEVWHKTMEPTLVTLLK